MGQIFLNMSRIGLILALALAANACTNVFFQPHRFQVLSPERFGLKYEDVYFTSSDGVGLHGWFLPARGGALGTILFLHGNAENISTHIGSVYWLPERGFNVFLLDYRGYGASKGEPSLDGALRDVEGALSMLVARPDVNGNNLVVFGQSLGGSLAIYAVAHSQFRDQIQALIAEGAFASFRDITREKLASFWLTWPLQYPLSWTVRDDYSPIRAIASIGPIPLLIIHGAHDSTVPPANAQRLFDAAREPKQLWVIPEAGHIQVLNREQNRDRFVAYLLRSFCSGKFKDRTRVLCPASP
jgi:uncharacterized protein